MKRLAILFAVSVAALIAVPANAAASPASSARKADTPRTSAPQHILYATDQVLSPLQLSNQHKMASTASSAAPFLTRPYWNPHSVTSIFDHCNPDYTQDGLICDGDGRVASRSNGADPTFALGYAYTPGGTDYVYYDGHNGWDLALNYENLIAAAAGTVVLAGCDPYNGGCGSGFGLTVTIDHGNGFTTRYGHMSSIAVTSGQHVERGDFIGVSGNTGASTGPHLHFGVYVTSSWTAIDPWGWDGAPGADPWPADSGNLWITGNPQNPVPWAPTAVTAAPGPGGAIVGWTPPAFDGGSGVSSYTVTMTPGGVTTTVPGTATSAQVTGLANGTTYTFTVVASNALGSSPASSASNAVTVNGITFGTLPTNSATSDFDVSWSPGSIPVSSYDATVSEDGRAALPWLSGVTATKAHFYGLAGHTYTFQLTAHSSNGTSRVVSAPASVASGASYPFQYRASYCLDSNGDVRAIGSEPLSAGPIWPGWDIARALTLLPDASGGYILDGFGGLHELGSAPPAAAYPYWPGWDIARDVAMLPDGSGGYVLDGFGGIHPFAVGSHAVPPPASGYAYWPGWEIARRLVLLPNGTGGYVLDGFGGIHPFGIGNSAAPGIPALSGYWPGWDIARAITLVPGSTAGYVLDGYGGVHSFGSTPAVGISGYWPGSDVARGIFENPNAAAGHPGGYTAAGAGAISAYGSAAPPVSGSCSAGQVRDAAAG